MKFSRNTGKRSLIYLPSSATNLQGYLKENINNSYYIHDTCMGILIQKIATPDVWPAMQYVWDIKLPKKKHLITASTYYYVV